jgi:pimeloyl-ACP methyl ester carboxylesterase
MIFFSAVTFFSLFLSFGSSHNVPADADVGKDMVTIVQERGYPIETHYVTTSDGYILTMFRIPYGKKSTISGGAPVILQHGLLDSSYTWVSNFEDESLGYILADRGYDVWFGNNRGNRYGRNHTSLNPDDGTDAFWAFSWDEMAMIDVPTMVHYVLDTTGHPNLGWVGHSEGTIQMFAAATSTSNGDDYLKSAIEKVNLFVALAPVAYVSNMQSKLLTLLAHSDILDRLYSHGLYEFLPYGPIEQVAPEICRKEDRLCNIFLMTLCGPTRQLNTSRIQVYVSETPAGTSLQNMKHWIQGVLSPTFQRYDYESEEMNLLHYGVTTPPLYDLSLLSVPTALFSGSHDYLGDPLDVKKIIEEAPEGRIVHQDVQEDYAHLDFVWAPNANTRIYNQVLTLLDQNKQSV